MKKIFFLLACAFISISASAQTFEVYENGSLVKSYVNDDTKTYKVVVKETPQSADTKADDGCYIIDGHHFVDLGLSSGLLWAETNIGAATAADDGDYFAWGETKSKSDYSWTTYAFGSYYNNLSKYNATDGLTTLESSDDAATVNWGSSCRMPTKSDFDELSNCTWSWSTKTTSDGSSVSGYVVTSASNGNSIFLPASGCRRGESLYYRGSRGRYWSSTRDSSNAGNAYCLYFDSGDHGANYYSSRCYGHPVRPVAER